ncbi:hemerythrin domain-containing protein [Chlorogloea sp. CCALA 695]|uniref:hemerythrin domain-containing protein n=1 Tax=Chlorogloea sp. CCALA 695 TaxID=2107693 RepID=UPI000D085494|nr:hemerythrin domain-containing protein [Chlorogloea sp. CCALA 695]PSB28892.1 DNA nickase [Chlorogloea sp. CCALA 695]
MVVSLDNAKRTALGSKLADIKALQNLLIANEQKFLSEIKDEDIRDRFQDMLRDDQKNLGVLDTVIVQYGVQAEPKETITQMVSKLDELMSGSELTIYEKVFQHELLKHQQTMSGITVHKAAQKIGADVMAAIAPLNTVNFENRAHQEQLKGVLEVLGVRELTGEEADQGIWARVQDAAAAFSGVVGSVVTHASDKEDMNIQDIIRMDHAKVNTLFTQVAATDDPQKLQEYFGQIYKDLLAHSEAEEQVVYPAVRPFYGEHDTTELYDEQAEMKKVLDEIKASDPTAVDQFKSKIRSLMDMVGDHIRQEESTMFAAIRDNMSSDQSEQLTTQFKAAKSAIQQKM